MPAAPQSCSDSTRPERDELDRRLDELLPGERIADLHRRALVRRCVVELLAREHGRAADPVAAGRRPVEDDELTGDGRLRAHEPVDREQPDAHRVDEAVVAVRLVEDRLAADRRDADAVPVVADPADGAREVPVRLGEAQAVEQRDRARAHRDDVAEDPADARRGALERLDSGGVVVALDLERDREARRRGRARRRSRPVPGARAARSRAAASGGAPSACSRSAPTRGARRPRARSRSGRAPSSERIRSYSPSVRPSARWSAGSATLLRRSAYRAASDLASGDASGPRVASARCARTGR